MCGIFGVFNRKRQKVNEAHVRKSTSLLAHRGPDGEGYYFDQDEGVALGHRRLSIIDLTTGNQPMSNETGTVWITFNGEIYNYLELKSKLLQHGHQFRSQSDTEVIIHAYEQWGTDCVKLFNGIFAFVIWDSKKGLLFLARDIFGVKPLYYFCNEEQIVFSSEIKSILTYTELPKSIKSEALFECIVLRQTPAPHTLIENINKIPASHYLTVTADSVRIEDYLTSTIQVNHERKKSEWIEILSEKLEAAIKNQLISDVPLGISLSGGVDSSLVLAIMNKYRGAGISAFTVGFEGNLPAENEIERARLNATRMDADFNFEIITDIDYNKFLDKYIWHLEEPLGNESAPAYYFVSKMAHGKVKVLLSGQGADELFAGYDRYRGMHYVEEGHITELMLSLIKAAPSSLNRKNQILRLKRYMGQKSDIKRIASAASILQPDQYDDIFSNTLLSTQKEQHLLESVSKIIEGGIIGSVVEKMLYYDMFSSLAENLLLSGDKMSMAASIECRVPFLDYDFAKTALSIPIQHKISLFSGKKIFKKMSEKYLSKDIIYQRKNGFNNPMKEWLKERLGEELYEYVNSANSLSRSYLNIDQINRKIFDHKKGCVDNQRLLFLLLSLEKWKKVFIDGNSYE